MQVALRIGRVEAAGLGLDSGWVNRVNEFE
jgi:hypothetical protein